jgi:hypothetical protein
MADPFEDGLMAADSNADCPNCETAEGGACAECMDGLAEEIPALQPEWFGPPWAWPWWYGGPWAAILSRSEIFIGVHGFKSAPDLGRNGNFGFHEGFNLSGPLGDPWGIGWQFGFRATHSDFSGASVAGYYDPGSRNQFFLTTGLFARKLECGPQWGVVFDYLHDNFYGSADLQQLRAELSLKIFCGSEVGFWGAFMMGDDRYDYETRNDPQLVDVESRDLYLFFWRQPLGCTGEGRIYGGFSGHGDGIVGVDCLLPIGERFALDAGFSYLAPKDGTDPHGLRDESWGLTISLVWYPARGNQCALSDPFRPVLPVADNRYFIQRIR